MTDHYRQAWNEFIAPGGAFAIETVDVRGLPIKVFSSAPPTMRSVWELARNHGDRTYLVYEDERYTYAEIDGAVRSLAHTLRERHGVGPGDRVAIAMRNYPEWVVAYWATVCIGAAAVGMNAWWTGSEMEYGLADSRPKVLIADDERVERVLPHLDSLRADGSVHLLSVRSDRPLPNDASRWEDIVDAGDAPADLPPAAIDPDDDACIFYTSGTTGFPKGAQLTHRGSVHNILHIVFMTAVASRAEQLQREATPVESDSGEPARSSSGPPVIMAPTPLFHVTACNCLLHPATIAGGTTVLMYRWDPGRALELIEREGVTNFSGVPTMSREMLAHPDWDRRDTSTLQGMGGGGAPLQPDLVAKIDRSLSGGSPTTGYGLTETHGIATANSAGRYTAKPESCGPVVPTLDAKLIDEGGNDLPSGPDTVGELCFRGSVIIKGYLNRPEATAEAIRDGWFRTGDIARIDDDGYVYIVDRAKDMVLRGGENIYCSEVEAAIYQLDDVAEAAVFGVPDERLGETVGVAIVTRDGATVDVDQLRAFLEPRLAAFKIPEHVWFRDEPLPRNANGKFVKRALQEEYAG